MRTLLLVSLLCGCAVGQTQHGLVKMAVPNTPGALQIDVGNIPVEQTLRSDGKEVKLFGSDEQSGFAISVFLQHVTFAPTAVSCRQTWWGTTKEAPGMRRDNVKLTESGDMARVDYDVPEFQGRQVNQHSVHAYFGAGVECAEVHLSKLLYQPQDDALFAPILSSVRLVADAAPPTTAAPANTADAGSWSLFQKGSQFFVAENYPTAAQYYQQALDLEKQSRSLNETYFKVLVDNLGMAYGISGDLEKSRTTLQYGVSQYPDYPMFHYNLACGYGEQGKMNEALAELKLTYKYKAKMIPGETIPDPLKDDSFRFFANNDKFVDAVDAMQSGR